MPLLSQIGHYVWPRCYVSWEWVWSDRRGTGWAGLHSIPRSVAPGRLHSTVSYMSHDTSHDLSHDVSCDIAHDLLQGKIG